jgi:hypothetical protein
MKYKKVAESKHWKDRAAGWHRWQIELAAPCEGCGKVGCHYTIQGTEHDAKTADPKLCDQCIDEGK